MNTPSIGALRSTVVGNNPVASFGASSGRPTSRRMRWPPLAISMQLPPIWFVALWTVRRTSDFGLVIAEFKVATFIRRITADRRRLERDWSIGVEPFHRRIEYFEHLRL